MRSFVAGYREYGYCVFVDLAEIVALETIQEPLEELPNRDIVRRVYAYLKSGHKIKLCESGNESDLDNYCMHLIEKIGTWNEFEYGNMEGKISWLDSKGEIV